MNGIWVRQLMAIPVNSWVTGAARSDIWIRVQPEDDARVGY